MNRILAWIRAFFGFSRTEANGFLILLPLCVLLVFIEPIYQAWFTSQPQLISHDKALLDSITSQWEFSSHSDSVNTLKPERRLFKFDPNTVKMDELMELGFEKAVVSRIVNYRSKGGRFKTKTDLKKIYGIDTALVTSLYAFITLPETNSVAKLMPETQYAKPDRKNAFVPTYFDINLADTSQLIQLKGIGSKLAQRIIKYREKLGGFVLESQLAEVFGLDSLAIQELNKRTFVAPSFVPRQININKASEKQLAALPYIKFPIAKAIVAYRYQHNDFTSIDELRSITILDETLFQKIKPYLTIKE
jgi:competence protein ComEA